MESPSVLYLSRADVERVALDKPAIVALLETAFRENAEGRVDMPPKPGLHPGGDAFLNAMPAYIGGMGAAGIKWVGGSPGNAARGLPYISGLIVLNDPVTLLPVAVMDCTWITAQRTAAASALSAKHLARPGSEVLGILGCGAQGRSHLEALSGAFPLRRVLAFDVSSDVQRRFAEEMGERTGLQVVGVDTPRKAVAGCDIVVTAGPLLKHPRPIADAGWLEPGGFASAVDYDGYWTPAALAGMDKVATDDLPQWRHMRSTGYFGGMAEPYADLGEIVTGRKPGRERDGERILAMNLGLALDDMAVAVEVYRRAAARGIGVRLPL
jgi:ornithine cyclodeaminase/alanine dehydrogenase-like protein (mu-crystallin family)